MKGSKTIANFDNKANDATRVNGQIRAREVRLIGAEGENLGVMSTSDALRQAQEEGLDLIEISPNTEPPVAKIMDWGRFKYEEQKRASEARKKQKNIETKELKFSPNIEEHDFMFKFKAARRFLEEGNKVKVSMRFRGREVQSNQQGGRAVFERIIAELGEVAKVDQPPKMEGANQMTMLLSKA